MNILGQLTRNRCVSVALGTLFALVTACSQPAPNTAAVESSAMSSSMPAVRVPESLSERVGIAYGNTLIEMSDRGLDAALDDAVSIGVSVIRTDLDWADIQPN